MGQGAQPELACRGGGQLGTGPGTGCAPGAEQWGYVYTADDERLIALKHGESRSTWTVRDFGGQVLTRDERYPRPTEAPEETELWSCPSPTGQVFCDGFETGNTVNWTQTSTGRSRKITDYVRRGSQLVGADTLDDVRRHFALDHLGSPRLVTNDLGEVVAQHTDFPFGQEATPLGQDPEVMKFTGHERDSKSTPGNPADDLDYLHARYSSPIVGRFLAVDPVLQIGPARRYPQRWNRYTYALGNPLRFVDPDGASPESAVVVATAPSRLDRIKDVIKNPRFRSIASLVAGKIADEASKRLPPGKGRGAALIGAALLTFDSAVTSATVSVGSFAAATTTAETGGGAAAGYISGTLFGAIALRDIAVTGELVERAITNIREGRDPLDEADDRGEPQVEGEGEGEQEEDRKDESGTHGTDIKVEAIQ